MTTLYRYCVWLIAFWAFTAAAVLAQDAGTPQHGTVAWLEDNGFTASGTSKAAKALGPFVNETGQINVSIDGVATGSGNGTIQVDKPAGATVRSAYYLVSALFRQTLAANVTIGQGSNSLTLTPADYDAKVRNASGNTTENGRADITSFIKPIVDAATPGLIDFDITESNAANIEGNILVVIFDDPNVSEVRTVVLAFGAQQTTGDSFSIGLSDPFDASTQSIEMSLGISFGFQPGGQVSLVDVNGNRLTSSAGGQDDGIDRGAGWLLTVGGIGDDPANPPDPFAPATSIRTDDELYTLDPLIDEGDTQILVETVNPSNDDNVYFAGFIIKGTAAVVGEGILLSPTNATNPVGSNHTVTATVQDDDGNPIGGRTVDFEVTVGPNAGLTGSDVTDSSGEATFTWSSSVAGTDLVIAETVDSNGNPLVSNEAQKTWTALDQCDTPTNPEDEIVDQQNRTITTGFFDQEGITEVFFSRLDNLFVLDADGFVNPSTDNVTWVWPTSGGAPPQNVTFVLKQVDESNPQAAYFAILTDNCTDPGPKVLNQDPVHTFLLPQVEAHSFGLEAAYPNPFGEQATIEFSLTKQVPVTLAVYDVMGRKVATLVEGSRVAGVHRVTWDGRSNGGQALASGVYLVRLQAGTETATQRLTIVR